MRVCWYSHVQTSNKQGMDYQWTPGITIFENRKKWQCLIWPFDADFMETRIFVKNLALSLFYIHDPLTSCKKSEKSEERFPNCPQTRIFRNMIPRSFCSLYFYLALCKKLKKSDERILRYIGKWWILAQIWPFDPNFRTIRIFVKNLVLSLFIIYDPLTSCKKSEKSDDRFLT